MGKADFEAVVDPVAQAFYGGDETVIVLAVGHDFNKLVMVCCWVF